MGQRCAFRRKKGISVGGMLIIVLVGCVGSVVLAAIVLMSGFAVMSICFGVIWSAAVLPNAAFGIWMSCGMLLHCIASPMNPRMAPWSGWFVPMGV